MSADRPDSRLRLLTIEEIEAAASEPYEDGGRQLAGTNSAEILAEIEDALTAPSPTHPEPSVEASAPRGTALPIIVNLVAVVVIVFVFLGARRYFAQQELTHLSDARRFSSTESTIIEEVRRSSTQQLDQKERELSRLQGRLTRLEDERDQLRRNFDSELKQAAERLDAESVAALAAERARLEGLGLSEEDLRRRIREAEEAERVRYRSELESYEQEMRNLLSSKEREIAAAQADRERLLDAARERETRLSRELDATAATLRSERAQARQTLQTLASLQTSQTLLADQVEAGYRQIERDLERGDLSSARGRATELARLAASAAATPGQGRTEGLLITVLGRLIETTDSAQRITAAADGVLTGIGEALLRAEELSREGRDEAAERVLESALADVAWTVSASPPRLDALDLRQSIATLREWSGALGPRERARVETAVALVEAQLSRRTENSRLEASLSEAEDRLVALESRVERLSAELVERDRELELLRRQTGVTLRERSSLSGFETETVDPATLEPAYFLGTVATVRTNGTAVVERLGEAPVTVGSFVLVIRSSAGARRILGAAEVAEVGETSLRISLGRFPEGGAPRPTDLVYTAVRGNR